MTQSYEKKAGKKAGRVFLSIFTCEAQVYTKVQNRSWVWRPTTPRGILFCILFQTLENFQNYDYLFSDFDNAFFFLFVKGITALLTICLRCSQDALRHYLITRISVGATTTMFCPLVGTGSRSSMLEA